MQVAGTPSASIATEVRNGLDGIEVSELLHFCGSFFVRNDWDFSVEKASRLARVGGLGSGSLLG